MALMAGACLSLTGCSVTVGGPSGSAPPSGGSTVPSGEPSLGEHPNPKNVATLVAWYRRNGYTISDAHEVDAPDGKVKSFSCNIQKSSSGQLSVERVSFYANDKTTHSAMTPPSVPPTPPVPPAPPTPPKPNAIPDAGASGLTFSLDSTRSDVTKWLAYYKAAGYDMTDVKEDYFPTGRIKYFHCTGKKPALLGSKTIEFTVDGVRKSSSASSTVGSTLHVHL